MGGNVSVSVHDAAATGPEPVGSISEQFVDRVLRFWDMLAAPGEIEIAVAGTFLVFAAWVTFATFWSTLFHGVLNALDLKKGLSSRPKLNRVRNQVSGYLYFAVRSAQYPLWDIAAFLPGLLSALLAVFYWLGMPVSSLIPAIAQLEPSGGIAHWFAGIGLILAIIPPLVFFFTYRNFDAQRIYQLKRSIQVGSSRLPHLRSQFAQDGYDVFRIERGLNAADEPPDDVIFWDKEVSAALGMGADMRYRLHRPSWVSNSAVLGTRKTLDAYISLSHVKDIFDALRANINNAVGSNRSFTNDKKIKMEGIRVTDGTVFAEISKTDYYTTEITNKTLSKYFSTPDLDDGNRIRHDFRQWMPFEREAGNPGSSVPGPFRQPLRLLPLCGSRHLSNHVGGVHLALSLDGYPLLAYQSPHSHESANSIVTNGCGSMDWADLWRGPDGAFLSVLQHGHARELLEETGTVFQDSHRTVDRRLVSDYADRVRIAGFYRSLNWGGLPLFVGFSRHFLTYDQILENYEKKHLWIRLIEVEKLDYRSHMTDAETKACLPIRSAAGFVSFFDQVVCELPQRIGVEAGEAPPVINTQLFLLRTLLANQKEVIAAFDAVAGTEPDHSTTKRR
jgi:hypothetical protein